MILPRDIRIEIADRMVRLVAPVIFLGIITAGLGLIFFGERQYHRLIPMSIASGLSLPAWFLAVRGKSMAGAGVMLGGLGLAILSGMAFSGGIRAPAYLATIACLTIFIILYGTRGGIWFAIITVAVGGLFVKLDNLGYLPSAHAPPPLFYLLLVAILLGLQLFTILVPVRMLYQALAESRNQSRKLQQAVLERKQAEEELQSILDKTPDIIYRLDKDGNITYISEAIGAYGYTPEELIGKPILKIVHPEDRALVRQGLVERRQALRDARELEIRLLRNGDGDGVIEDSQSEAGWATFLISSNGLYASEEIHPNAYIGTQGIARDISRIRQFETQIAQLASVVEQAAEDVVVTDREGIIQYVNPKFEEITGYSKSEVIGKTPRILKSGKHDPDFYAALWNTLKSGEIWKGQIWNRMKAGRLILQDVTITPIFDAAQNLTGYASVRRDVTQQVEFEGKLRQSKKMEAIGTLAGGIAHDFNNILSGIMGYTELALEDVKDNPATKDKLDRVLEAGIRATDLVTQILSFSRSQQSDLKPVSPHFITKEVLKLMRASLPATIDIKQALKSESLVLADATNIHQVLMNLCTNAAHALRENGGVLSVKLEDVDLDQKSVQHYIGLSAGPYLKISVEDTGCGIPKDVQEKVFDPFYTTKELGEGTGMGLSAVHGIIQDLGGAVTLYSEVDKGTVFHVYIPVIADLPHRQGLVDEQPFVGGTERILFVDDEVLQIDLARESLGRMGYRVNAFSDSLQALAHYRDNPDVYDLIITDMTMPKMTGDLLVQEIHGVRPEIPVIMCTGFSEAMDEQRARAIGIHEFLYKPVVKKDLLGAIRRVLDAS